MKLFRPSKPKWRETHKDVKLWTTYTSQLPNNGFKEGEDLHSEVRMISRGYKSQQWTSGC